MPGPRPKLKKKLVKRAMNDETAFVMDEAIRHAVDLEALKNYLAHEVSVQFDREVAEALIDRLESKIERIRNRGQLSPVLAQKNVKSLLLVNQEIVRAGLKVIQQDLKRELGRVSIMEAKVALKQVQSAYVVNVGLKAPSPALLRAAVEKNPVRGDYVASWFKKLEDKTVSAVNRQIRIGLAEGKTASQISRDIRGTRSLGYKDGVLQKSKREVNTLVRTSVQNVVIDAREQTYAANSDIVKGVRLIAVLDSRTTFICMSEDQQVYPIGQGPRPPLHFNCRTTTVPELASAEELGLPFKSIEGKRAALGAKGGEVVSANSSYPQWFATQPAAWQKEVLGPARFDLYQRGVPLAEMKGLGGRRLSVDEIKLVAGLN